MLFVSGCTCLTSDRKHKVIKPVLDSNGRGTIRVDCDTCIAGVYFVVYDGAIPETQTILDAGTAKKWDTSNRDLLRCPLCVAEGVVDPV